MSVIRLALMRALRRLLGRTAMRTGWVWLADVAMNVAGLVEDTERPQRDRANAQVPVLNLVDRSRERQGGSDGV